MNELRIAGRLIAPKIGWNRLSDTLGGHFHSRLGWRLVTSGEWNGRIEWNGSTLEHLGPRSIRTLRFGEAIPVPYYFPGHGIEDFRDGGLHGIDPCGSDGLISLHDAIFARMPLSLVDLDTGKNRTLSEIQRPQGGAYYLDRVGDTSVLPECGATDEIPYDGQHGVRAFRVALRYQADEFVKRDLVAMAHDAALSWDRARADRILHEPKGEGSGEIGREWAWCSIAAVLAGNTTLADRMRSIAKHVATPLGNLQINSGGNPAPPPGRWFSDMEAHFQVQAMKLLGMDREAKKLADVCVGRGPLGKYINADDGRTGGGGSPTHGTAWAAIYSSVYSPAQALAIAKKWPIMKPAYLGGSWGPFADKATIRAKLIEQDEIGKNRTAIEALS